MVPVMESLVALRDRREQVIARLSEGYAQDLYDVDELDRRLDLAHGALTVADLDALVADLGAPSTALVPAGLQTIDDPTRQERRKIRAIMSAFERKGHWVVPRTMHARAFWGAVELDFREASLAPGVTTLEVRVTMGSVELILPPQLAIDVDVSVIMGSCEQRHRAPVQPDPSRALLRVTGRVLMGSVEIFTRLPGESERDARRREKRERKQLRAGESRALPPGRG
jgi:hypothetical protein